MTGVSAFLTGLFPKKAVIKTTEEVVLNIAKEVKIPKKYLKPSETLAFSQKALRKDGFYKIADYVYRTDRDVAALKSLNAPESLITHAKSQYPLRLERNISLKWNTPKLEKRITNKRNEAQIEKLFKNKAKAEQEYKQTLAYLKKGHLNFADTDINDPDEILKLIKSGEYARSENAMLNRLSKVGNSTHSKEIMPQISKVIGDLERATDEGFAKSDLKYGLAAKIKLVGLVGDDAQQAELIKKLETELKANHDKNVVIGIFRGLSGIGNNSKNSAKYSELLRDQLFTQNKKMVYSHLADFDGQFHLITQGMIENPKNSEILAAAYKSAKTSNQKQILLNEILKSQDLTDTAINSTSNFHMIDEHKAFVADILSEIKAKKFDSLSTHYQSCLDSALNG